MCHLSSHHTCMCDWTLNAKKLALRLEHIFFSISCGLVFSHSTNEPPRLYIYVCFPVDSCVVHHLDLVPFFLMVHCLCSITTILLFAFAQKFKSVCDCTKQTFNMHTMYVPCLWVRLAYIMLVSTEGTFFVCTFPGTYMYRRYVTSGCLQKASEHRMLHEILHKIYGDQNILYLLIVIF